jgi:phosphotriesterase-related protein
MTEIMTVLGPIEVDGLGFTSMHEHVLYDGSVYFERFRRGGGTVPEHVPVKVDDAVSLENIGLHQRNFILSRDACSMTDEAWMTAEVQEFNDSGGDAMIDQSAVGLRNNLPAIQRISRRTGVHIIATTGFYTEDSWPEGFTDRSREEFEAFMLDEVENGIEHTGIKPGAIKIAITDFTEPQERLLRAAARVMNASGLMLTVHPGFEIGNDGRRIVRVLKAEGADLERVVIAHGDAFFVEHDLRTLALQPERWGLNTDYHKMLMDQGANISVDCFGHQWSVEYEGMILERDWQRLGGLVALIKAEYSPQIVLGTDTFIKILTRRGGGDGYTRLTKFVIPTLRELGVSDYDIRQMTVVNPMRLLGH